MDNMKEVFFRKYCATCEHADKPEEDEPCRDCLAIGGREHSHRPEYWKDKNA